ncbi:MAG: DUF2752 domain-containing protein [Ruminococcus sp.]|nr:DUF2752 domain-containing protein [Ruminococcus sp.]
MKRYKTYQKVLVVVLPLLSIPILYFIALFVSKNITLPMCIFYKYTGMYCAGCGETRAVNALLEGNVLLALRQNALIIIALLVAIILYIETILKVVFEKKFKSLILNYKFMWTFLGFLFVYSILRNFIPQIAPI